MGQEMAVPLSKERRKIVSTRNFLLKSVWKYLIILDSLRNRTTQEIGLLLLQLPYRFSGRVIVGCLVWGVRELGALPQPGVLLLHLVLNPVAMAVEVSREFWQVG